jgi:hypothetical protein
MFSYIQKEKNTSCARATAGYAVFFLFIMFIFTLTAKIIKLILDEKVHLLFKNLLKNDVKEDKPEQQEEKKPDKNDEVKSEKIPAESSK